MTILLEDRINELKQRVGKMKKEGKFFYLKTVENTSESRVLICLLYTSPSPRDGLLARMPSSA